MKKVILLIITIVIIIFIAIILIVHNDKQYNTSLYNKIDKNTSIPNIAYVNYYDNYYIALNNEYLYILDNKYKEILKIDNILIADNKHNYDIIYKDDKVMYSNEYFKDNKLYYEYYDLYSYKLINKTVIGG